MEKHQWIQNFAASIIVCDEDGVILEMNDVATKTYENSGGTDLIGKNLYDCHSPASVKMLKEMMANQQENIYTISKKGQKKLIYQHPWYQDGKFAGLVEISLPIPEEMPHFDRG